MSAPVSALEAAWKREVPVVLGCCVVELQRCVEARALGLKPEHLPQNVRAFWREMCAQADTRARDLDQVRMRHFMASATGADAAQTRTRVTRCTRSAGRSSLPTNAQFLPTFEPSIWITMSFASRRYRAS